MPKNGPICVISLVLFIGLDAYSIRVAHRHHPCMHYA